jgi:hypothetical protein
MAFALYRDTMDMAVYTAGKGRMWRQANVLRPDTNTYKVWISPDEALNMTAAWYAELVSQPRGILKPPTPTLSRHLSTLWTTCRDKVERHMGRIAKRKQGPDLVARYQGKLPETLTRMMAGDGIKAGVGFQELATQLAISAHAFSLSCEDFLTQCQGLCETHVGDGTRYRSEPLRRKELARMWHYMNENPTYEFSAAALRKFVDHNAEDLAPPRSEAEVNLSLTAGMSFDRDGIYKLEDGARKSICSTGLEDPVRMQELATGRPLGYLVKGYCDGDPLGEWNLTFQYLNSKASFQSFLKSTTGSGCNITDVQVNGLVEMLRVVAKKGGHLFATSHEGLDVVTLPEEGRDVIWVGSDGVLSRLGKPYKYLSSVYGGGDFPYKVNLLKAPRLLPLGGARDPDIRYLGGADLETLRKDLHDVLRINSDENLAKLVGWVIACFICPVLRNRDEPFPLLHVYGPPSTGKSTTIDILKRFHGHTMMPPRITAGGTTLAPMIMRVSGTVSIPYVLEEYKPSEMGPSWTNTLRLMLRSVFDASSYERGRLSRETGDTQVVTSSSRLTAPTAFLSEYAEEDSAVNQRSVVVTFNPQDSEAHKACLYALKNEGKFFGSVGRFLVENLVFVEDIDALWGTYQTNVNKFLPFCRVSSDERAWRGVAAIATGLDFFRRSLSHVFGDEFTERLEVLEQVLVPRESGSPGVKSQKVVFSVATAITKVLTTMSDLSVPTNETGDWYLLLGRDYVVNEYSVVIDVVWCYRRYQFLQKRTGDTQQFTSAHTFRTALNQYVGATETNGVPYGIRNAYALDKHQMYEVEGIPPFYEGGSK